MLITWCILVVVTLSIGLLVLATAISNSAQSLRLKYFPFECGYDGFTSSRVGFSLHFYLVALLFLVFDIEIALLLPIPLSSCYNYYVEYWVVSVFVVVVLIGGLYCEWKYGTLSWL